MVDIGRNCCKTSVEGVYFKPTFDVERLALSEKPTSEQFLELFEMDYIVNEDGTPFKGDLSEEDKKQAIKDIQNYAEESRQKMAEAIENFSGAISMPKIPTPFSDFSEQMKKVAEMSSVSAISESLSKFNFDNLYDDPLGREIDFQSKIQHLDITPPFREVENKLEEVIKIQAGTINVMKKVLKEMENQNQNLATSSRIALWVGAAIIGLTIAGWVLF